MNLISLPSLPRTLRSVAFAFIGACSLLVAPSAFSRPGEVDDTDTLEKGHTEYEAGVEYEQKRHESETVIAPAITRGLTEWMEVELGLDYVIAVADDEPRRETFLPAAKFKAKFWHSSDDSRSLAFAAKIAFPVEVLGPAESDDPEGSAGIFFTQEHGAWQFDADLGYGYRGAWHTGEDDKWIAGVDARYQVSSKWQICLETIVEQGDHAHAPPTALVDAGAKYYIKDSVTIDLLVGTGIGRDSVALKLTSGVQWEF